jgi:hypothetical protein
MATQALRDIILITARYGSHYKDKVDDIEKNEQEVDSQSAEEA